MSVIEEKNGPKSPPEEQNSQQAPPSFHLEEMVLNMGPQHPSTHGVLRLVLHLDGELVVSVEPVLGYLHRGFEKLAESRTYLQYMAMISRLDYLSGFFMEWGYVRSVEALMGIRAPKRAEYIRVILGELNRIMSHQVAIGDFMLNLGAVTPFFWVFRDREDAMDLMEMATGQRMMYNYLRVGGVRWDLPDEFEAGCRKFISEFPARIDEYEALITDNEIFISRTLGMGIIKPYEALDYGISGPNARASGVDWDLRREVGYSVYPEFDFDVPLGQHGDCFDRYKCRIEEMRQSVKIIEQALDSICGGPVNIKLPPMLRPPAGDVYRAVETPRGEYGVYIVSNGGLRPWRLKLRDPTFSAISMIPKLTAGNKIADLVAIVGSLDLLMGGVDR
ncbi:MAG: NADH-quinone oxidoreductase subunit D [Actinobacteria bacterium]|nr:NADH-quinone oxidoreductase subunit D [Actinomycetota bacterium]